MKAVLALEDGTIFPCKSFTGPGESGGELVFNTGMTGYQEVLTNPSYSGQMVVMTYPLIGSYGVNDEDVESDKIQVSSFIVKEYQNYPSNYRSTKSLSAYLQSENILGIHDLDTRGLVVHLRESGTMRGFISTYETDCPQNLVEKAKSFPLIEGRDLVKNLTTTKPYFWDNKGKTFLDNLDSGDKVWKSKGKNKICVFDFGVSFSVLNLLDLNDFEVLVVPAFTSSYEVKNLDPDGVFLSNGPGDPKPLDYAVETIKNILGFKPIFGICLGTGLAGLAVGGNTFKLKHGHRGPNNPVKKEDGSIESRAQNHGFAIETESIDQGKVKITHLNLNDDTIEGFKHKEFSLICVQHLPEASPGLENSSGFFSDLKKMINDFKTKEQ
ncbi:MAG: glutamine-hydrolyzing carbamoyl-phosphate synthase small subunit [Desulforegulaceae bacterium]|nr:glutamine-hydrolyzing carbamoyl-phosphate synthase small subunit [Desulforegulaceae bacterium]